MDSTFKTLSDRFRDVCTDIYGGAILSERVFPKVIFAGSLGLCATALFNAVSFDNNLLVAGSSAFVAGASVVSFWAEGQVFRSHEDSPKTP